MSTTTRILDRLATLVAGLVLIGVGVAAFCWDRGLLFDWPDHPDVAPVVTFLSHGWVPWVAGVGGVVAVVVGVWWLVAHLRRRRVATIDLDGGDGSGAVTVDLTVVASAAATELAKRDDIVSCRSATMRDRRQTVVELLPALSPTADLSAVVAAAERVDAAIDTAVGSDVHVRVAMTVKRGRGKARTPATSAR